VRLLTHHPVSVSSLIPTGNTNNSARQLPVVKSLLWGLKRCLWVPCHLTCVASILGPPSGPPCVHNTVCSLTHHLPISVSPPRTAGVNHEVSIDSPCTAVCGAFMDSAEITEARGAWGGL